MSNLSELLPTGGGQNAVDFVATGTLASGQTVALKSDGTVEAVSGVTEGAGTPTTYASLAVDAVSSAYDPVQNVFMVCYRGGSNYGYAVIGSVSGSTISFASPVVFTTSYLFDSTVVYDANAAKFLIIYLNGSSGYVDGVVGTVSGGVVSFGSITVLYSAGVSFVTAAYSTTQQKTLIFYAVNFSGNYGYAKVATVSGTSVSVGAEATVYTVNQVDYPAITYHAADDKMILGWRGTSSYGYTTAGTISGTSVSFGTTYTFNSAATSYIALSYDVTEQTFLYAYQVASSPFRGDARVGQLTGGTGIALDPAITFMDENAYYIISTYVPSSNQHLVLSGFPDFAGTFISVSDTTPTKGTSTVITTEAQGANRSGILYDSNLTLPIVSYKPSASVGSSAIYYSASTNNTDFIGITAEAISNAATGPVNVYGGINEAQTGLTIGSNYYVQADGSISTTSSAVKIGQAISATTINMMDLT